MVDVQNSGPGWLSRALWFIFIGPAVLTLRSSDQQTTVVVYGNGMTVVRTGEPQQVDFLLRAVYFLFVGWWLGYLCALVGYVLCFTLVLMPIGVMMLNRLPTVLTLRRI
jgi:uncharacterized membrane protein YccF (DUF307 family)